VVWRVLGREYREGVTSTPGLPPKKADFFTVWRQRETRDARPGQLPPCPTLPWRMRSVLRCAPDRAGLDRPSQRVTGLRGSAAPMSYRARNPVSSHAISQAMPG
jgi:hypothetical protein